MLRNNCFPFVFVTDCERTGGGSSSTGTTEEFCRSRRQTFLGPTAQRERRVCVHCTYYCKLWFPFSNFDFRSEERGSVPNGTESLDSSRSIGHLLDDPPSAAGLQVTEVWGRCSDVLIRSFSFLILLSARLAIKKTTTVKSHICTFMSILDRNELFIHILYSFHLNSGISSNVLGVHLII